MKFKSKFGTYSLFTALGALSFALVTAQPAVSAETAPSKIILAQAAGAAPGSSTSSSSTATQAKPSQAAPKATAAKTGKSRADRIEARIAGLKSQLKITQAQESQWNNFAGVMRDNDKTVGAMIEERRQKAQRMNAVDDLKSYEAITEANAAGLKKLVSAFETLYGTMSDQQKKIADGVFDRPRQAGTKPAAKKAG